METLKKYKVAHFWGKGSHRGKRKKRRK